MSRPPELDLELIRLRAEQDGEPSPSVPPRSSSPPATEEIIVRADEVEGAGDGRSQRPILRREGSAPPPPPRQPPPPAPPNQDDVHSWGGSTAGDSLSMAQLRDLVSQFPTQDPKAYAYTYSETRTFAEEIEEWFQYTEEDKNFLVAAKDHFTDAITEFNAARGKQDTKDSWTEFDLDSRKDFVSLLQQIAMTDDLDAGEHALLALAFLAVGGWIKLDDRPQEPSEEEKDDFQPPNHKYKRYIPQLKAIKETANLLVEVGMVEFMVSHLKYLFIASAEIGYPRSQSNGNSSTLSLQLTACLTTLYFVTLSGLEEVRLLATDSIRSSLMNSKPDPLQFLTEILAPLRWEPVPHVPFTRVLLLLWKLVILIFGSSKIREETKRELRSPEEVDNDKEDTFLTASPLDYHVFRQEITSKYPAYNPPPPLIPLEINNNTMLPVATPSISSHTSYEDLSGRQGAGSSIFHQPTHIATPAPSPPPTPGGPGKGGKKQNYQTNQNFPFLYPPLDGSSNDLGGKGGAEMQDRLVGKRWEGSDVPASILEAAELFHRRERMTRAMRQLWEVREQFLVYDRGWSEDDRQVSNQLDQDFDSDSEKDDIDTKPTTQNKQKSEPLTPQSDDPDIQGRLHAIEKYYRGSFTNLQSLEIVLLKVLVSNVNSLGASPVLLNGEVHPLQVDMDGSETIPKENLNLAMYLNGMQDPRNGTIEVLNSTRTREITSKAISGILLSLLKWFRVSHILKFEYFTQLLLDANYIPASLKYFALQDVDKAVDLKHDNDELSFFRLCHHISNQSVDDLPPSSPQQPPTPESIDEAIPPPISRARPSSPTSSSSSNSNDSPPPSPGSPASPTRKPEVDELGFPTSTLPSTPLTIYAPRFFQTYISLLRILQKLTKSHAHRSLLLVQYKSSTILRKGLKIPQPELRLYTLKLFKSQVPYCGRKWRQNNMRVITAIYVFCKMGLRDEWISGSQGVVDEWVEGAREVERAWRGLVGWWHRRTYREVLGRGLAGRIERGEHQHEQQQGEDDGTREGIDSAERDEEEDFFARELEKMGWSIGGLIEDSAGCLELEDEDGVQDRAGAEF